MDLISPTPMNILTSPAYMAMPGNIYNSALDPAQTTAAGPAAEADDSGWLVLGLAAILVVVIVLLLREIRK